MHGSDFAIGKRDNANSEKRQIAIQRGDVGKVARKPVERFGKHSIEAVLLRSCYQIQQARPVFEGRSRNRRVGMDCGDAPAVPVGVFVGRTNLVCYRPFVLQFARETGIDGDSHSLSGPPWCVLVGVVFGGLLTGKRDSKLADDLIRTSSRSRGLFALAISMS